MGNWFKTQNVDYDMPTHTSERHLILAQGRRGNTIVSHNNYNHYMMTYYNATNPRVCQIIGHKPRIHLLSLCLSVYISVYPC